MRMHNNYTQRFPRPETACGLASNTAIFPSKVEYAKNEEVNEELILNSYIRHHAFQHQWNVCKAETI